VIGLVAVFHRTFVTAAIAGFVRTELAEPGSEQVIFHRKEIDGNAMPQEQLALN
jgi:hypothetical protein